MKFYLTFCSIFFITFSSYAVPVGGITKFFKGLFSKGDEIIDISSKTGKSTNELSNEISELLRFIDPETYKGQSFQEIIDEISAFNAEPIEGLKKFYNPSENVSSAMSNDDYSLWLEYYSARGIGKYLQKEDESKENKIKTCPYLDNVYNFLEVSTGELILISINNKIVKTVLNEVYANDSYKQYTFHNDNNFYQFLFFKNNKFLMSNEVNIYINEKPDILVERCIT